MVKVSLAQIKLLSVAVGKLLQTDTNDWKMMFRLEDFKKEIEKHLNTIQKVEHKMYEKYGDKTGDQLVVPKDKEPVFFKELGELMGEEVEIDIQPIDPSNLKKAEINTFDFLAIKPFLSEGFIKKFQEEVEKEEEKDDGH